MTAIWQHFVLNSELWNNSDIFDTILLRYSDLEPLYHYLATLLFIYRIIEMLYGIWIMRFFHPDTNSNRVYMIKTDVIFWQEKDSYHRNKSHQPIMDAMNPIPRLYHDLVMGTFIHKQSE
jgi:hypothetical protein